MKRSLRTIMVIALFFTTSATHAERQRLERKTRDAASAQPAQENYIITHYGLEYYTPVAESAVQMHNDGYFTAEVIPVDVKTGEELKTINNLYVPLHTGYSIGSSGDHLVKQSKAASGSQQHDHLPQPTNTLKQPAPAPPPKNKFEKKFKFKNSDIAKKNSTRNTSSAAGDLGAGQDSKQIKQIRAVADDEKFYFK